MGNFNMLPSDIVLDILSRLPTESILECKFVSKPWKNVVKHPSFSLKHLNHLNAFDSGKLSFIFRDPQPYPYTEYDESLNRLKTTRINFIPPTENCCILGSCNGLICFFAWFKDHYSPAYICNPITREYVVLPEVNVRYMLTGFGYIPSTNEYKVVSVCNQKGDQKFGNVQVYTLGSGIGWRNLGSIEIKISYVSQPGEFANGAIYWVDKEEGTIHAFDLAVEEIRIIPSPRAGIPKLQAVEDFLCAAYKYDGGCDTWVLKKDEKNQDVI
ncbi:F-box protein At3g07870-like [Papaver somniferum]|uniref:F-box protein At3g07870-like n=1 Tax=Papaver somniferum TaxID=3469 RepID=UPI000E6FE3A1|nr:F-box protein At3g07870-like [Papaver somniferum]